MVDSYPLDLNLSARLTIRFLCLFLAFPVAFGLRFSDIRVLLDIDLWVVSFSLVLLVPTLVVLITGSIGLFIERRLSSAVIFALLVSAIGYIQLVYTKYPIRFKLSCLLRF